MHEQGLKSFRLVVAGAFKASCCNCQCDSDPRKAPVCKIMGAPYLGTVQDPGHDNVRKRSKLSCHGSSIFSLGMPFISARFRRDRVNPIFLPQKLDPAFEFDRISREKYSVSRRASRRDAGRLRSVMGRERLLKLSSCVACSHELRDALISVRKSVEVHQGVDLNDSTCRAKAQQALVREALKLN